MPTPGLHRRDHSGLVESILTGAWRHKFVPLDITGEELAQVMPLLVGYGSGALAWNRVSLSPRLKETPAAIALQQINRHLALEEVKKERAIRHVADLFGAAGLEPMIFKGWAIARYYPRPYQRPFGDLDICAPPERYKEAAALLTAQAIASTESARHRITHDLGQFFLDCGDVAGFCHVDLHSDLDKFELAPVAALYARSRRINLGAQVIRVPAPEDHLRLAAIHFLIHGGWRPLWLCDIAAMLESSTSDFDWRLFFGSNQRIARWIACVCQLAHVLLGARIEHVPLTYRVARVPPWILRAVLREWLVPFETRVRPFSLRMTTPRQLPGEIGRRWPNPIMTTLASGRSVDQGTPWLRQLAAFGARVAAGAKQRVLDQTVPPQPTRAKGG